MLQAKNGEAEDKVDRPVSNFSPLPHTLVIIYILLYKPPQKVVYATTCSITVINLAKLQQKVSKIAHVLPLHACIHPTQTWQVHMLFSTGIPCTYCITASVQGVKKYAGE